MMLLENFLPKKIQTPITTQLFLISTGVAFVCKTQKKCGASDTSWQQYDTVS